MKKKNSLENNSKTGREPGEQSGDCGKLGGLASREDLSSRGLQISRIHVYFAYPCPVKFETNRRLRKLFFLFSHSHRIEKVSSVPLEQLIRANGFFNFKVGVNGYGFVINNNGFVLFHPGLGREVIAFQVLFSCFLLLSGDSNHSGSWSPSLDFTLFPNRCSDYRIRQHGTGFVFILAVMVT